MEDSEEKFHLDEIEESDIHSEPCKKRRRRKKKNDKGKNNKNVNKSNDKNTFNQKQNKKVKNESDEFIMKQIKELHKELFDTKLKINNILSKLDNLKNNIVSDNINNLKNNIVSDNINNSKKKCKTNSNKPTNNKKIRKIVDNIQLKIEKVSNSYNEKSNDKLNKIVSDLNTKIINPEDKCRVSIEMAQFLKNIKKEKLENKDNEKKFENNISEFDENNLTIQLVISSIHIYIKNNNLQDIDKKTNILYDQQLKNLFKLKKNQKLTYFNLPKYIRNHIN